MEKFEVIFDEIEENKDYENVIMKVLEKCYEVEKLSDSKLSICITLTTPENIRRLNNEHRNVDYATDVLSFPVLYKDEIENAVKSDIEDTLGDIVISIDKVKEQAEEYGHSFERELSYMVVHGFYHLMGEDHMEEEEKKQMREKEENVLNLLNITRD